MAQTLEQIRASHAWESSTKGVNAFGKEYVNRAKSVPTLIMNSGLMQTLAFMHSKEEVDQRLLNDVASWLLKTALKGKPIRDFSGLMVELQKADALTFRACTSEAMAILRWIRQFAPAVAAMKKPISDRTP